MLPRLAAAALCIFLTAMATARADQEYAVDGRDTFHIPGTTTAAEVAYAGTGRLRAVRAPDGTRFTTRVEYRRTVDGTTSNVSGSYATTIAPDGSAHDGPDGDPDDLTILKQPFAVLLDAATLHDLRALHATIPFDFPSPIIGATLHGALRRLPDAMLHGRRVLGIAFAAHGPLHGSLPDRPQLTVSGAIEMNGHAYYGYESALLLALDSTLSIAGTLDGSVRPQPVRLVYRRTIRPLEAAAVR
jgi:hypothetical protein